MTSITKMITHALTGRKRVETMKAIRIEHALMNQLDQFCNEFFNRG